MGASLLPLFDSGNPAHRTIPEWAASGLTTNWWINCVAYAVRHGESRVLLRMGNVLVLTYAGQGPLVVEEVP